MTDDPQTRDGETPDSGNNDLLRLLLEGYRNGVFTIKDLVPAADVLLPQDMASSTVLLDIYDALKDRHEPELMALCETIQKRLVRECFLANGILKSTGSMPVSPYLADLPKQVTAGWQHLPQWPKLFYSLLPLLSDLAYAINHPEVEGLVDCVLPDVQADIAAITHHPEAQTVLRSEQSELTIDDAVMAINQLPKPVDSSIPADLLLTAVRERFKESPDAIEHRLLLGQLCLHPTAEVADDIIRRAISPDDQLYVSRILMLRFGFVRKTTWEDWSRWLVSENDLYQKSSRRVAEQCQKHQLPLAVLRKILANPDQVIAIVKEHADELAALTSDQAFIVKWRHSLSGTQYKALAYGGERDAETPVQHQPSTPPPLPSPETPEEVPPTQPQPPEPSVWNDHIRPMLAENTYVTAGIAMVLVGTALLAYFTWDKHWVFRYSIMPILTGAITFGFAEMGIWLEKRSAQMREMGVLLRGGAVALVPFNFMVLCLLAGDPAVQGLSPSLRMAIVAGMGVIYLGVYNLGLLRWCRSVLPELKIYAGWTCALINAHVVVGALVLVNQVSYSQMALLALCHTALAVIAFGTWRFATGLPRAAVNDRWVTGFYGGAVAACFVESIIGLYIFFKATPEPYQFAFLLILSGGIILFSERRLFPSPDSKPREESFIGFALIVAGLLAGMNHEIIRIVAFIVAGVLWLFQARGSLERVHNWIGMTLITLGLGAVGAVKAFPVAAHWNPIGWLGIAIIFVMIALSFIARQLEKDELALVAQRLQTVLVVITTGLAVLVQWRYQQQSTPLYTAGVLALCAGTMVRVAWRENSPRYLQSAMAVVVVLLPYLGCVNMRQPQLTGNVMVFGLAVVGLLWIGLCRLYPSDLFKHTRSGVLWGLGAIAMSAMVLRVLFEGDLSAPTFAYRFMDEAGPLLMAVVLVAATWYSRSLVPAAMASVILAVLFPELKANYRETAEILGYGSGLGSAVSALLLTLGCIPLQRWGKLTQIPAGDAYLGVHAFPLQRYNASLFTLPLGATALFLVIKVCSWNLLRQFWVGSSGQMISLHDLLFMKLGIKAACSLVVAGCAWFAVSHQFRNKDWSGVGIHAAWVAWLAGMHWLGVELELMPQYAMSVTILAVILTLVTAWRLSDTYGYLERFVIKPYGQLLSLIGPTGAFLICLNLFVQSGVNRVWTLVPVILALNLYCGWKTRNHVYGYAAMALLSATGLSIMTGIAPILPNVGNLHKPLLVVVLAIHGLLLVRELLREGTVFEQSAWLATAGRMIALGLLWVANILWLVAFTFGKTSSTFGDGGLVMLLVAQLVVMRGSGSMLISLWFFLIGHGVLAETFNQGKPMVAFLSPWRIGIVVLVMALAIPAVRIALNRYPQLCLARGVDLKFAKSQRHAFQVIISLLCLVVGGLQVLFMTFDPSWSILAGCYLAAAALLLLYWSWPGKAFAVFSIIFEVFAGIAVAQHVYYRAYHDRLFSMGITPFHMLAVGLVVAGLQIVFRSMALTAVATTSTSRLRQLPQDAWASYMVVALDRLRHDRFWLTWLWSGTVRALLTAAMVLLTLNYLAHPGIQDVTWLRYVVSGSLALFIALYFRYRARSGKSGSQFDVAMYHYSVTMALWCMLLLIPVMKDPSMAFLTFSVAPIVFWLLAERHRNHQPAIANQYGTSALVFIVVLYVLYMYTPLFDSLVYKGMPLTTGRFATHYHSNSPIILLLSVIAIRLHAITRKWWSPIYGGIVGIIMSLLVVTWVSYPRLSPFHNPLSAAWVSILFGHAWLLLINRPTPVRAFIQTLSGVSDERLAQLSRIWSACVSAVVWITVVYGSVAHGNRPKEVAVLLLVTTTVLLHHMVFERAFAPALGGFSGLVILVALHMDFLIPSYLQQNHVVWVLILLWSGALVIHELYKETISSRLAGLAGLLFGGLVLAHVVLVHHPESGSGLIAFAVMALLAAATPMPTSKGDTALGSMLLVAPLWLAFFSQSRISEVGVDALLDAWPYLTLGAASLGIAIVARECSQKRVNTPSEKPRLYHALLSELNRIGLSVSTGFLIVTLVAQSYVLMTILGWSEFGSMKIVMLSGLMFPLAAHAWYQLGRLRPNVICTLLAEINLAGMAVLLRHILLLSGSWNVYYDVWSAVGLSMVLTALKQVWDTRPEEERQPAYWTIWALPVLTLVWALYKQLGTDVILLVIALHSLMFAYLGGNRRESPYHAISVIGFVSFMLILLARLEFRAVNAYVIPIGLGGLVLLQLFRNSMEVDVRNRIRTVCLLGMIGSSTWYALLGNEYPIGFNLTLIVICLLAMLLGSFLKIRIYVLLGFTGLMIDLISLLYKGVRRLDRNYQMASIGALLLLVGVSVVAGAAWCRVNREKIQAWTARLRNVLGEWE